MNKKKFSDPKFELIEVDDADILTASMKPGYCLEDTEYGEVYDDPNAGLPMIPQD